jgi:hypothetical protein
LIFFSIVLILFSTNLHIRSTHTNTQIFNYLTPTLLKTITSQSRLFSTAITNEADPTNNGPSNALQSNC